MLQRRRLGLFVSVLIGCVVGGLIVVAFSHAQAPGAADACSGNGVFDGVLCKYKTASGRWSKVITQAADWLFWTLALISMTWTFSMHALRRGDILEVLAELTRFTIFVGFFFYLLQNGTYIGETIIASLRQLAAQAGGVPNALRPSGLVDLGLEVFFHVLFSASMISPLDALFGFLLGVFVLIVLVTVAADMLLLLVAAWVLLYSGIFFLGFGGSKWTSEMAIAYFRTVLSIAVQTFAMILLVAVGKSAIDEVYKTATDDGFLYTLGVLLVVTWAFYRITTRIPPLLGQLVTGTHASHAAAAGGAINDSFAVIGSTAAVGAAFATGGAAIAAGVAQAGGMLAALRAATGVARMEAAAAGAGSVGPGVGPLAAAFGETARRGTGAGAGAAASGSTSSTKARSATAVSGAPQEASEPNDGGGKSEPSGPGKADGGARGAAGNQALGGAEPNIGGARSARPTGTASDPGAAAKSADDGQGAGAPLEEQPGGTPEQQEPEKPQTTAQSTEAATDSEETGCDDSAETPAEEGGDRRNTTSAAATGMDEGAQAEHGAGEAGAASTQTSGQQAQPTAMGSSQASTAATAAAVGPAADGAAQSGGGEGGATSAPPAETTAGAAHASATSRAGGKGAGTKQDSASAAGGPSGASTAAATANAGADSGAAADATPQASSTAAAEAVPVAGQGAAGAAAAGAAPSAAISAAVGGNGSHASTAAAPPRSTNSAGMRTAMRAGEILAGAVGKQAQQAAHDAIENMRARAAARIANTAGGRLAQSLKQAHQARTEPPADSEVDAFRDGGGSIGASDRADSVARAGGGGRSRPSSRSNDPSAQMMSDQDAGDPALRGDDSSGPGSEIRGSHESTGIREDDDGEVV